MLRWSVLDQIMWKMDIKVNISALIVVICSQVQSQIFVHIKVQVIVKEWNFRGIKSVMMVMMSSVSLRDWLRVSMGPWSMSLCSWLKIILLTL